MCIYDVIAEQTTEMIWPKSSHHLANLLACALPSVCALFLPVGSFVTHIRECITPRGGNQLPRRESLIKPGDK